MEASVTRDRAEHHLLDRPRDKPWRTALGAAALTFYVVLFTAASNDLLAHWFALDIETVTRVFRVLVLVMPPIVGYVTLRLCRALQGAGDVRLTHLPFSALRASRARSGDGRPSASG